MFNYRKLAVGFAASAFVVSVVLIILLLNLSFLLSSSGYLASMESKTATPQLAEPAMDASRTKAVSDDVISYVRGDSQQLSFASSFTQAEVSHLADVRRVIRLSFSTLGLLAGIAAVSAFLLFLLSKGPLDFFFRIKRAVLIAGIAVLTVSVLFIAASSRFDFLFTKFHQVFFQAGNWQFPSNYLIVNLFTADFFSGFARDMFTGIIINGAALVIAALVAGYLYQYVARTRMLGAK